MKSGSTKTIGISHRFLIGTFFVATAGICVYSLYYITANANWVLGDTYSIVGNTIAGNPVPNLIGANLGRFWPLGLQEFNLFLAAGNSPKLYYAWQALKLGATLFALVLVLSSIRGTYLDSQKARSPLRWLAFCLVLTTFVTAPRLFSSFANIIFAESTLILCILLFSYFYLRAVRTDATTDYAISLLCANYAIYLKEPVFGSLIIAVGIPYVLSRSSLSQKRKAFSLCIVLSGFAYLTLYYFVVFQNVEGGFYNQGRSLGQGRLGLAYSTIQTNPALIPLIGLAVFRLATFLRQKDREAFIFDGLLYGGLAYGVAFILLNMDPTRYLAPVYAFVAPSIFFYIMSGFNRQHSGTITVPWVLIVSLCFLLPLHLGSWKREIESSQARRTNEIPKLLALADAAEGRRILLIGRTDTIGTTKWYAKVLNGFLQIYGYPETVEHSFEASIIQDSQRKQSVILVAPSVSSDPDLIERLHGADFQHLLTFWVGLKAFLNFAPQAPRNVDSNNTPRKTE